MSSQNNGQDDCQSGGQDGGQDGGQAGLQDDWSHAPAAFRSGATLAEPWASIFGPLREAPGGRAVVGQIGQSLDGRIATPTGHSHYINGPAGLDHLHRLRALVDAVAVGAGTVRADNPQLTVRRVAGPSPVRVMIDPRGTLAGDARVFADDGIRRIVLTAADAMPNLPAGVEVVKIALRDGALSPRIMIDALAERGLRRVLIEGGAQTVSRFLAAGCLDRLHIVAAPVIFGSGPAGISLPPIARADEAMRVPVRIHRLDDEVLFDCDVSRQRAPGGFGQANRSA
jgi:diaminohydroxyphosphoribosylaminopyrimidine deaminase / 5-amino-6-(5-phosphoribosylamino)uracil reductase